MPGSTASTARRSICSTPPAASRSICEGVDTLVLALGHERVAGLEDELAWPIGPARCTCIGDCLTPRTAEEAVLEGLKVGSAV